MAAPRARDRLGADTPTLRATPRLGRSDAACGLETRASIDVALQARRTSMKLMKLKISNEEKKAKQKAAVEPPHRGR